MRRATWLLILMCGVGACAGRASSPPEVNRSSPAVSAASMPMADSGTHVTVLPDGRIQLRARTGPNTRNPIFVINGLMYEPRRVAGNRVAYQSVPNQSGERVLLPDVDPTDIEEVEVLNSARAIERYGRRAHDGAVVVLTRPSVAPESRGAAAGSPM